MKMRGKKVYRVYANRMTDTRMWHQRGDTITIGNFTDKILAEKVANEITKTHKLPDWFVNKAEEPNRLSGYWDYARAGVAYIEIIDSLTDDD